jgi:hypothetical protein
MAHSVAIPTLLSDPGMLWAAAIGTADPTNTVAGSVFTDDPAVAYIPLGPTAEGSTLNYSTTVEPMRVAEFFDPIRYATTERGGNIAFAMTNYTLSNYRRAMNGGIAALTATSGTGATSLFTLEPPEPGAGEISSQFTKAPDYATIPCTFNMEIPTGSTKPFTMWSAGTTRG